MLMFAKKNNDYTMHYMADLSNHTNKDNSSSHGME